MRPADIGAGGGGVRIVLMPEEMKRGAGRLLDTAHSLTLPVIGCLSIPELGPGCGDVPGAIQSVQSTLKSQTHVLTSAASELQKRAFFAEIAGAMMAGYPLSGAQ